MKKLSLIIVAFLVVLVCCKKTPQVNIQYVDVEREVLTIGATTANVQCDYEYIATLKNARLYYGRTEGSMRSVNMRVVQSVLYAEIDGLSSNTTYRYYYEFENGFNSMHSGVKTFTTEGNPTTVVLPTVITADVTEITAGTAVSGGQVTADGGGNVTTRGVCWSTSPNPTISDSFTTDGTGVGSFVSNLTGLSNNTTYHVRAYATNEAGTAYGLDKEFTTLNGGGSTEPPTIITSDVTGITAHSAICGGEVTSDGGGNVTARGVCWSTSSNPTISDSFTTDGTGVGSFVSNLTGLSNNTTYHVRAYATNEAGTAYGLEKTFTTLNGGGTAELPVVVTNDISGITAHAATCGGEVISDGGAEVTVRGVCWSTNADPTINDNHVASGSGTGSYTSTITGLTENTTYHVRAYATNEVGTAYGLEKTFTTLNGGGGDVPPGAINGLFTINNQGDKVYFSQGNLQYQASTNTWRFAENQWDYVGEENANISPTYDGWIDLFGWGTSGWDNGNVYYHPFDYNYLTNWNAYDYGYGYGPTDGTIYDYDLTDDYANSDWGEYNPISNGENVPGKWRTLIADEWTFLCTRTTQSGLHYAKAIVNNVSGVIMLPDNWSPTYYEFNYPDRPDAPFNVNEITEENWALIEANGAVFLPAAGYRRGTNVYIDRGQYWSASCPRMIYQPQLAGHAFYFLVYNQIASGCFGIGDRSYGLSVRLVQDAQ